MFYTTLIDYPACFMVLAYKFKWDSSQHGNAFSQPVARKQPFEIYKSTADC